jgi:hypothetical protein
MDPQATLQIILDGRSYTDEVSEALETLLAWLNIGGFPPVVPVRTNPREGAPQTVWYNTGRTLSLHVPVRVDLPCLLESARPGYPRKVYTLPRAGGA